MRRVACWLGGCLLCVAALIPSSAQAQWGGSPLAFGGGFGPWGLYPGFGFAANPNVPTPPYFALHPPVYYGELQRRPYGLTPFAAWPETTGSFHVRHSSRFQPRAEAERTMLRFDNPYLGESVSATPVVADELPGGADVALSHSPSSVTGELAGAEPAGAEPVGQLRQVLNPFHPANRAGLARID